MQTYEHTLAETVFAFKVYIDGHFRFSPFFLLLELFKESNDQKSAKQVKRRKNKSHHEIETRAMADLSIFQLLVTAGDRCSSLSFVVMSPAIRQMSAERCSPHLLLVKAQYLSVFPAF